MFPGIPVRRWLLRVRSCFFGIVISSSLPAIFAAPSHAVIGGEELAMRHFITKYVVGIRYEDDKGAKKICAGAIIGSHIVVTAAHCTSKTLASMSVVFGDSMRPDRVAAQLAVASVRVHENFEKSRDLIPNPYDIAVIRTKTPLPAAARHQQLAAGFFPISQIPTVYVVGYGAISVGRDGKAVGQGQLYSAIAHRTTKPEYDEKLMIAIDQSKGTGICLGDGGAPMVVENKDGFILMGIASTIFEAEDAGNMCGGVTTFVNVHEFQEWIIQQAFELMQVYR